MKRKIKINKAAKWINNKFGGKGIEVLIIDWDKQKRNNYSPSSILEEYAAFRNKRMYTEKEVLDQLNILHSMKKETIDMVVNKNNVITKKWFR